MPCPYAERVRPSLTSLEGVVGLDVYCKSAYVKVSSRVRPCLTDDYVNCPFYPRKGAVEVTASRFANVLGDLVVVKELNSRLKDMVFLTELALDGEVVDTVSLRDASKLNLKDVVDKHVDGGLIYAYLIPKSGSWRFRFLADTRSRMIGLLLEGEDGILEGEDALEKLLEKREPATLTVIKRYGASSSIVTPKKEEVEEIKVREIK